ncbi:hypothetical protein NHX12_022254 [Muraenolepis orangiensis]|uniref:stearoyl-CoA 9-desaturase n=1 Tax=Muraenolepis orangiensis TaxID=630683 RepID=A0A9Q0ER83_9TELE|nr:hypothetical protein NHX12_022254 [Muraenolepis orangiensis]
MTETPETTREHSAGQPPRQPKPPQPTATNGGFALAESSVEDVFDSSYREKDGPKPPVRLVWRNIVLMILLHSGAVYGAVLIPDHRVHHKYSETDADPHNALRGFFFSHIGWLLVRKHPDVLEKGRKLELSDLRADPVVMFQRRHYKMSVLLICFLVPMLVPWYLWGESLTVGYFLPGLLRYTVTLNSTWLVNSAAHMWGNRPYDQTINPRENRFVAFSAVGEGFHNYHHTFPFDYSTSEYGHKLNLTTAFIDLMFRLGLASDRKKVSQATIRARAQRTGEASNKSG